MLPVPEDARKNRIFVSTLCEKQTKNNKRFLRKIAPRH
jgi:hypothetical protein